MNTSNDDRRPAGRTLELCPTHTDLALVIDDHGVAHTADPRERRELRRRLNGDRER